MTETQWQERYLPTPDGMLAVYEKGDGPVLLFLHGGPGDDHRYLRTLADPLAGRFRCVLYDQRGSGNSPLGRENDATLHVDRFFEDIDRLRDDLGVDRVTLVGHSWGAMLALFYAVTHPQHVERLALIGLGPLSDEMSAVAGDNQMQRLNAAEREEFSDLKRQRREAEAAGDHAACKRAFRRLMELRMRGWFYSPELAAAFLDDYLAVEEPFNPAVSRYVYPTAMRIPVWELLDELTAPLWIAYGYQDFEPITQAFLLRERMPQTQIALFHRAGHLPWLEQPQAFTEALSGFLQACGNATSKSLT